VTSQHEADLEHTRVKPMSRPEPKRRGLGGLRRRHTRQGRNDGVFCLDL